VRRLPLELVYQGEPVSAWSGRRLLGDGGDRPSDVFACDHAWPLLGILAPDQANFFEYCGQSDHLLGRKPPRPSTGVIVLSHISRS
jgi:hypothetical protein